MANGQEFSDYSIKYSKYARPLRTALPADFRQILDKIEDELVENPDRLSRHITPLLSDSLYLYKYPQPQIEVTYQIEREGYVVQILHIATPSLEVAKSLFISYSHLDEKWLIELKKWLGSLERQDLISIWDDNDIKAGDKWREEIEQALYSAKAAVLLISQNFLNSEFIRTNELPSLLDAAEERGLRIFWIAVGESLVDETNIINYQAAHKDPPLDQLKPAIRAKEFKKIYKQIKEAVESA